MTNAAFDLGQDLDNRKIRYYLHRPLWATFNYPGYDFSFVNWNSIKYLDTAGTAFDPAIATIPDNVGGLYMFYVKCPIITGMTEYPLYIGRAQLTNSQNLRKRVKEYFQHWARNNERPKITRMIRYWGPELYLAYYPLPNNVAVVNIEKDIINATIFQMNDRIPDQTISEAIKAFS